MIDLIRERVSGGRLVSVWLVFVFALGLSPSAVFGHAKLVRSQPSANAVLRQSPKTLELWFSEELESSFSTIIVSDQNGNHVDKNNVSLAESGQKLQIDLEDLGSGTYTVEWKALSTDQHTMKGKFAFTVALAEVIATAPSASAAPGPRTAAPRGTTKSVSE